MEQHDAYEAALELALDRFGLMKDDVKLDEDGKIHLTYPQNSTHIVLARNVPQGLDWVEAAERELESLFKRFLKAEISARQNRLALIGHQRKDRWIWNKTELEALDKERLGLCLLSQQHPCIFVGQDAIYACAEAMREALNLYKIIWQSVPASALQCCF